MLDVCDKQAAFSIFNSNLSEYGVLGFELGYSLQVQHTSDVC